MLQTVVLPNIFVETIFFIFQDFLMNRIESKEHHVFEILIFCNIRSFLSHLNNLMHPSLIKALISLFFFFFNNILNCIFFIFIVLVVFFILFLHVSIVFLHFYIRFN